MYEFPFWDWGFDQPFRHEPAIGPEIVREGGEVFRVAVDGEEVDRGHAPFWEIANPN